MKIPQQITTLLLAACLLCGSVQTALCQNNVIDEIQTERPVERFPDTKAEFQGGLEGLMQFLSKNISYPPDALDANIQGMVLVEFVVKTDGSIDNIKVIKSVHESLDNEAIRVVKLTDNKWIPAKLNEENVTSTFILPMQFKIAERERKMKENTNVETKQNGKKTKKT